MPRMVWIPEETSQRKGIQNKTKNLKSEGDSKTREIRMPTHTSPTLILRQSVVVYDKSFLVVI